MTQHFRLGVLVVGFVIAVIRIWSVPVTADEWGFAGGSPQAWSTYVYQAFSKPQGMLMRYVFPEIEPLTAIRVVSLVPAVFFFFAVHRLKLDWPGFLLLALNPFLLELFSVGKGYAHGLSFAIWSIVFWRERKMNLALWCAFGALLGHLTFAPLYIFLFLRYFRQAHWSVLLTGLVWYQVLNIMLVIKPPGPFASVGFQWQHVTWAVLLVSLAVALYLKPRWLVALACVGLLSQVNLTQMLYIRESNDVPQMVQEIKGLAPCTVLTSERIKWNLWYYLAEGEDRFVERYYAGQFRDIVCIEAVQNGNILGIAGSNYYLLNKKDSASLESLDWKDGQLQFIKEFPRTKWKLFRLTLEAT
jgi:hypothetical protein